VAFFQQAYGNVTEFQDLSFSDLKLSWRIAGKDDGHTPGIANCIIISPLLKLSDISFQMLAMNASTVLLCF
jgi:hypothetical protein